MTTGLTIAIILTVLMWALHYVGVITTRDEPGDVRMITAFTFIGAAVGTIVTWLAYWIF